MDVRYESSEADLYHARMQLEERLKYALGHDFAYETPLTYVQRFFDCAFSPEQQNRVGGPIRTWKEQTETFAINLAVIPLSQQFHPVYIAAAYLNWNK